MSRVFFSITTTIGPWSVEIAISVSINIINLALSSVGNEIYTYGHINKYIQYVYTDSKSFSLVLLLLLLLQQICLPSLKMDGMYICTRSTLWTMKSYVLYVHTVVNWFMLLRLWSILLLVTVADWLPVHTYILKNSTAFHTEKLNQGLLQFIHAYILTVLRMKSTQSSRSRST